ncbi:hypothetical protein [Lysinibacillus sp. SGAir0095]|uniref:DUF6843 domain-containing protein n=1 Tax=Lysinibacillus sp. SGAir0095 TaxID=2070463 RepID=UPI0010CD47AB|nr:hypothetical protein [Lysinibacillus sp. SGAir0095]QCR31131.1 hypothetical protein C1N55_02715 [Lysinibacillus sp. SGAir0095]
MRLLKVILASAFLSFTISLIVSLISYTPKSKKEPDVYYSSTSESFFFSLIYISPILLTLGIIAFIIYVLLGKIKRFSNIFKGILSIVIAASITFLTLTLLNESNETDDIYLIPNGYEGDVYVFYNIKGAPMVEKEDDIEVHVINEKGYFLTSKPDMDYGTVTDRYYYVDEKGNRISISNKCVSLFGASGLTKTVGDEEFDFIYTGFKLTKDNCSDEFMAESHGNGESAEKIIRDILKDHYGVDYKLWIDSY